MSRKLAVEELLELIQTCQICRFFARIVIDRLKRFREESDCLKCRGQQVALNHARWSASPTTRPARGDLLPVCFPRSHLGCSYKSIYGILDTLKQACLIGIHQDVLGVQQVLNVRRYKALRQQNRKEARPPRDLFDQPLRMQSHLFSITIYDYRHLVFSRSQQHQPQRQPCPWLRQLKAWLQAFPLQTALVSPSCCLASHCSHPAIMHRAFYKMYF